MSRGKAQSRGRGRSSLPAHEHEYDEAFVARSLQFLEAALTSWLKFQGRAPTRRMAYEIEYRFLVIAVQLARLSATGPRTPGDMTDLRNEEAFVHLARLAFAGAKSTPAPAGDA